MSFKVNINLGESGWHDSGPRFKTRGETESYAERLGSFWPAIQDATVVEVSGAVTHSWINGRAFLIPTA